MSIPSDNSPGGDCHELSGEMWQWILRVVEVSTRQWQRRHRLQVVDADDVGQEVIKAVLRALREGGRLRDLLKAAVISESSLREARAYLRLMCRNTSATFARRRSREHVDGATAELLPDTRLPTAGEALELDETRSAVRAALASLPSEDRRLVQQLYFEGLTVSEVGNRHGVTRRTIWCRKDRVFEGLRAILRRSGPDD